MGETSRHVYIHKELYLQSLYSHYVPLLFVECNSSFSTSTVMEEFCIHRKFIPKRGTFR